MRKNCVTNLVGWLSGAHYSDCEHRNQVDLTISRLRRHRGAIVCYTSWRYRLRYPLRFPAAFFM